MNCFNSERYLRKAIESVLVQTYEKWELIFWDNQSTDSSAEILSEFEDPRIRYLYSDRHASLGEARNLAVSEAEGEWLAFLDCDDVWLPEKLEKQVSLIMESDADVGLIYGGMEIIPDEFGDGSGWATSLRDSVSRQDLGKLPEGDIFESLLQLNFVPLLSGMVRRSRYAAVGGINPALQQAEDYDLFLKVCKEDRARVIREVVCGYRVHDDNTTGKDLRNNFEEAISVVSQFLPLAAARKGVRAHQTYYAIHLIRTGDILEGLIKLFREGSVGVLMKKIVSKL